MTFSFTVIRSPAELAYCLSKGVPRCEDSGTRWLKYTEYPYVVRNGFFKENRTEGCCGTMH